MRGPLERAYALYVGPIDAIDSFACPADRWWPDDRAWCIAADTDLTSTYVGGSHELVDDLLHHRDLEALRAVLDDVIVADLDPSGDG